jgi:hypothetical protein
MGEFDHASGGAFLLRASSKVEFGNDSAEGFRKERSLRLIEDRASQFTPDRTKGRRSRQLPGSRIQFCVEAALSSARTASRS